jgi:type II secretory pathway pseudopilin PulG
MKRYIIVLFLVLSYTLKTSAQNPVFVEIDTTKFPSLKIDFSTAEKIETSDISIFENDKKCDFKLNLKTGKKAVFILIESSYITHNAASKNAISRIVAGLTQFSKNAQPNTDFSFGYYNRSDAKNTALKLISNKFQPITNKDIEAINRLANQPQINSKWTDLYKATYESLDWISKQSEGYASKQLIIIGTGKALSESPIKHQECIKRAKDLQIQISTIGLKSNDRYAFDNFNLLVDKKPEFFINAENNNVIDTAITKYIEQSNFNNYTISFDTKTSRDSAQHNVKIILKGKIYDQSFVSPKSNSFFAKYLYWIIGIIIIGVIAIISFMISRNKKKKKEAEIKAAQEMADAERQATLIKEQELAKNTPKTEIKNPSPPKRGATQITVPPSSITIINNGKTDTIGIIKGITSFGRNNTNNIVIENDTVSGSHFTLEFTGIDCILSNLSTSNGTTINGVKQNKSAIYAGDIVKAGNVEIYFK